jgi:hypothetical protein
MAPVLNPFIRTCCQILNFESSRNLGENILAQVVAKVKIHSSEFSTLWVRTQLPISNNHSKTRQSHFATQMFRMNIFAKRKEFLQKKS